MSIKVVIGLVLAGLLVLFTLQNTEVVELRFLFWTLSVSRALVIFLVFATGLMVGWLLHSWIRHKKA